MKPGSLLSLAPALLFAVLVVIPFQKKPWPVPDAAKNKKNPVASTPASLAAGKSLWDMHCKSCHGTKGLGDGPKASQLDTEPGDFSKNDFQAQTDGAIYYKTAEGRDDMPGFKKKIPGADDNWALVNYMRTFKKGGAPVVPVKDTVAKKTDKPPVVTNQPARKDSTAKKDIPPITKPAALTVAEQVGQLSARLDSLEKLVNALKAKVDTLHR